jgi:hypothetical protein
MQDLGLWAAAMGAAGLLWSTNFPLVLCSTLSAVLPKAFALAIGGLARERREAPIFLDSFVQSDIRWSIEGQFPHPSLFTWLPPMLSRPIWLRRSRSMRVVRRFPALTLPVMACILVHCPFL